MFPFAASMLAAGAAPYIVNAVDYDGTDDWLSKAADLTGNADSKTGIFSAWFRLDGGNGATLEILNSTSNKVNIFRSNANIFRFNLIDTGSKEFIFSTSATYTSSSTWLHVLSSWNTNFGAGSKVGQLYVNNASDYSLISDPDIAFDIDYTQTTWGVASTPAGGSYFNGAIAELYFAPGQYLDFSNSANRAKFISGGKPVSLGTDGSTPTGVQPILYLPNPAASVGTNAGSGGNFTINSVPATASSSPSD